ncbi:hypothetical protein P3L51_06115 [Streptomyces sp. PSRA5]|uniref:hypothetical protein n=1 Tax=Streptomyces panacea TaxID=3035064 RepID=UPI00339C9125
MTGIPAAATVRARTRRAGRAGPGALSTTPAPARIVFGGLIVFAVPAAVVRRGTPGSAALVTAGTVVMALGVGFGRNHCAVPLGMVRPLTGLSPLGRELDGPAALTRRTDRSPSGG